MRVSSDGTSTIIKSLGFAVTGNVGDIDSDGNYWLPSGGQRGYKIDLQLESDTYGDALGYSIADWVYIPSAGPYLYAVAINSPGVNTATLMRLSLSS